jgi:hypothetical protein
VQESGSLLLLYITESAPLTQLLSIFPFRHHHIATNRELYGIGE